MHRWLRRSQLSKQIDAVDEEILQKASDLSCIVITDLTGMQRAHDERADPYRAKVIGIDAAIRASPESHGDATAHVCSKMVSACSSACGRERC